MATGLYMLRDGSVMVAYGPRRIPISRSQYKANGYKPALEKLATELPHALHSPTAIWGRARPPAGAGLSRFRLANQRIGFLQFAACTDSQGVWHGGKVSGYGER